MFFGVFDEDLTMDIVVHFGVYRHIRHEIQASAVILILAIVFDVLVLAAFLWIKAQTDMMIINAAIIGMVAIFVGEHFFLRRMRIKK